MATSTAPHVPLGDEPEPAAKLRDAAVQRTWPKAVRLSSLADACEQFVGRAGFERAPWLTIAFAAGVAAWFALDAPWEWSAFIGACLIAAIAAAALWRGDRNRAALQLAVITTSLLLAAGVGTVWARSALVGAEPITRTSVTIIVGRVLDRQEQPAQQRIRLVLAIRDAEAGIARKIRINLPAADATPAMTEGAVVRLRARLSPPAPPMLPGGYDFARRAWFDGLAATGSALGPVEVVENAPQVRGLAQVQRRLAAHVREQVDGSAGTIAAAFASGDRGAIDLGDEKAMRDSGLTHLLSISGVHVSAVIAAGYLLALKLLALSPWLALRIRLPVLAAGVGALAGVGYTLLTGAEVPTVRSCIGALLVLTALAIGREPLSVRMLATAAFLVLLVWPEALIGPSFQMSFAAVLAIIALHESRPVKAFLAAREESWLARQGRRLAMLLATGLVIEAVLTPIVLFHFHRAGLYGAFANVIAIPLVTLISMPAIALGLLLDTVGLGRPAWWVSEKSLEALLAIAHWTADQPGAVKLMPQMGAGTFALFVVGGIWLALWHGRVRLLGLVPVAAAAVALVMTPVPDVLVSTDGRQVGITGEGERLLMLRETRSEYVRDNLLETAGLSGEPISLKDWPGAQCSRDFCTLAIERDGRKWALLMALNRERVEERALASACERADIVIADRWLPASCRPTWLKADRKMLEQTGGLAIYLPDERIETVAASQGDHGWWHKPPDRTPAKPTNSVIAP
ncbi:ComEC/Rec2 family competence protein [Altererythrobacter sp. H2]|uniref:ComEC/Rec2 family competence protein n=1 Tax=Altererythrobacter sp. H2 TaxID=3108391 RepID=UPI002B4C15CD|nr:ComEC/Rec2 family competence protein [Altererythrobacter sp. H2]WRK94371.1 ComEC/Rec2 family competence protein [Altererythrobacter sp. H2]